MPSDYHLPSKYQFVLGCHLDARWAIWFEGLTIVNHSDGSATLSGLIVDQAALHGILARIRDLGLPLVEVRPAPGQRSEAIEQ
jgi:hypothetical protein